MKMINTKRLILAASLVAGMGTNVQIARAEGSGVLQPDWIRLRAIFNTIAKDTFDRASNSGVSLDAIEIEMPVALFRDEENGNEVYRLGVPGSRMMESIHLNAFGKVKMIIKK